MTTCDAMQGEVLSPASRRKTKLFDWSPPAPSIQQEIGDYFRRIETTRRGSRHGRGKAIETALGRGVSDEARGDTCTGETEPSKPTITTGHDVPAGPVNFAPFRVGWEKYIIWTPIAGWITSESSSSEPTPPPTIDFRDHPKEISVGPQGMVGPAETGETFNDNTNIEDPKVVYSAYDCYIQRTLKRKSQAGGATKKRKNVRWGIQTRQPLQGDQKPWSVEKII